MQISQGIMHLHQRNIVHHDIAGRNIVVTRDLVCKIANFGFAVEVAFDAGKVQVSVSDIFID